MALPSARQAPARGGSEQGGGTDGQGQPQPERGRGAATPGAPGERGAPAGFGSSAGWGLGAASEPSPEAGEPLAVPGAAVRSLRPGAGGRRPAGAPTGAPGVPTLPGPPPGSLPLDCKDKEGKRHEAKGPFAASPKRLTCWLRRRKPFRYGLPQESAAASRMTGRSKEKAHERKGSGLLTFRTWLRDERHP